MNKYKILCLLDFEFVQMYKRKYIRGDDKILVYFEYNLKSKCYKNSSIFDVKDAEFLSRKKAQKWLNEFIAFQSWLKPQYKLNHTDFELVKL